MEPLSTTIKLLNSKYLLHKSRESNPLIRCDYQVFNGIIKRENIDNQVFNQINEEQIIVETDHQIDSQLLQIGIKTEENINTMDTDIKIEKDSIDSYEFEGRISNDRNSSEFIYSMNSDSASNSLKKNPFSDNCNKMPTASNLTVLSKTHTLHTKPYKCAICDKVFSKNSNLLEHVKTHIIEKRYECDICDQVCSRADSLTRHKRIHTREMPYKCDLCDQAFARKDYLNTHAKKHTRENPYICDTCDQAFSEKSILTKHKRTHTEKTPIHVIGFLIRNQNDTYRLEMV